MWPVLRAGLHALRPETAHAVSLAGLGWMPRLYDLGQIGPAHETMGLQFPNRVGLAAGYDKNGTHLAALGKLGFGFIEVGTVTPLPQRGSTPPRLFRLRRAKALINRMGFNNDGADRVAKTLARQRGGYAGIVGCNIGHNRGNSGTAARADYQTCLRKLYGLADYYVVNVSSPNTPGLRDLQEPRALRELLDALMEQREALATKMRLRAPLLVKVAPELDAASIEALAGVVTTTGVEGVITTNTTVARPGDIMAEPHGGQPGGLSGAPLRDAALAAAARWRAALPDHVCLIGVGGLMSAADARERFESGVDLIQLYTGLVYAGPALVPACAAAGG